MVIEEALLIKADIRLIWETFTDLTAWPGWNTVAAHASSDSGRLEQGQTFTFTLRMFAVPIRLELTVDEVVPCERVVWSGSLFFISSDHAFLFQQAANGVLVTSRETFRGLPMLLSSPAFPKNKVRDLTVTMLADLKKAAETKNGR